MHKQLTLWLDDRTNAALDAVAAKRGLPRATAVKALILEAAGSPSAALPPRRGWPVAKTVPSEAPATPVDGSSLEPVSKDWIRNWERNNPGQKWRG